MTRPLIGLQNPVIGYADPFHPRTSLQYRRTGEGQDFPAQDSTPSVREYLRFIRELGADFYMHHVIPEEEEIRKLTDLLHREKMPYLLGNEFYSINGPYYPGTGRGDCPAELVERAEKSPYFMGLLYDETEHRQLHSKQYRKDAGGYEWADPRGKTADRIETEIGREIGRVRRKYHDCPIFSEQVFPVMYHVFSRYGMNPCPKLLKEEYQPLQIAVSLGAARQYGRKYSVCVDLWGFDVGNWFTRLWGFPGHSPEEFESALKLAWHLAPYMIFVENIDALGRHLREGFVMTEFGRIFQNFKNHYIPAHSPDYSWREAKCDIAVIHSDDSYISKSGNFDGNGSFGSPDLLPDEKGNSFFDVMSALLQDTVSSRALTYFLSGQEEWPAGNYRRTEEALGMLPLERGVGTEEEKTCHPIFHPMPSTLVFDQYVKPEDIGDAKLLIVCGSRLAESTPRVVAEKVREGAAAVVPEYFAGEFAPFLPEALPSEFHIVKDFTGDDFRNILAPYTGSREEWTLRFGEKRIVITNPSKDGRKLEFTRI